MGGASNTGGGLLIWGGVYIFLALSRVEPIGKYRSSILFLKLLVFHTNTIEQTATASTIILITREGSIGFHCTLNHSKRIISTAATTSKLSR